MSQPRIISGTAKGIHLASVPGDSTRPISDRVKESLFNIISTEVRNSSFLDLFGGTGSVGIEALSRGAGSCTFLELNSKAVSVIRKNLESTKTSGPTVKVLQTDALRFLAASSNQRFDYIYIAPPQYKEIWKKTLLLIDNNYQVLSDDGWAIVQIHPIEYQEFELVNLEIFDNRKYGSTLLLFYQLKESILPK